MEGISSNPLERYPTRTGIASSSQGQEVSPDIENQLGEVSDVHENEYNRDELEASLRYPVLIGGNDLWFSPAKLALRVGVTGFMVMVCTGVGAVVVGHDLVTLILWLVCGGIGVGEFHLLLSVLYNNNSDQAIRTVLALTDAMHNNMNEFKGQNELLRGEVVSFTEQNAKFERSLNLQTKISKSLVAAATGISEATGEMKDLEERFEKVSEHLEGKFADDLAHLEKTVQDMERLNAERLQMNQQSEELLKTRQKLLAESQKQMSELKILLQKMDNNESKAAQQVIKNAFRRYQFRRVVTQKITQKKIAQVSSSHQR